MAAEWNGQGAELVLQDEVLTVTPTNAIYVRYLKDNQDVIGKLASELNSREVKVEIGEVKRRNIALPR